MESEISTFIYRGYSIPIYFDDAGQQFYCYFDGDEICFGSYNNDYSSDLRYLIDLKLDTICEFDTFPGAKLCWFLNGSYKDIQLIFRKRILKVYLVSEREKVSETDLKLILEDSLKILKTLETK